MSLRLNVRFSASSQKNEDVFHFGASSVCMAQIFILYKLKYCFLEWKKRDNMNRNMEDLTNYENIYLKHIQSLKKCIIRLKSSV